MNAASASQKNSPSRGGNRTGATGAGEPRVTSTYDVANQLTRILTGGVPSTFTYDAAGNTLTQRNASGPYNVTMTWDAESRLVGYHQAGSGFDQRVTHIYNGDGLRVERDGFPNNAQYVWDGQNVHLNLFGVGSESYLYEPRNYGNLIVTGSLLYPIYDNLGSTIGIVDPSGFEYDAFKYDSWGVLTAPSKFNTKVFPFLFAGREGCYWDEEGRSSSATTPLLPIYMRGRFYQPLWGRWLNPDPLGFDSGDFNLYRYVRNNPIILTDPSGLVVIAPWPPAPNFNKTNCASAQPTSSTAGCGVHHGIVLWSYDAECVCKCAGSSPWDNLVRGCLECAQKAGVPPGEAHTACYAIADAKYGSIAGLIARLDIGLNCGGCYTGCVLEPPPFFPP